MASGTAALVQITLASTATTATVGIGNELGAGADASGLTVSSAGFGVIAVPAVSSVTCNPASLGSGSSASCSVSLTTAAPTGGTTISLSSSNALLTVPVSVAVAANSTTAMFNATAGASIPDSQNATVTATLGSNSQTANVSLVASVAVSSLTCNPASLVQGASSTCTVALAQSAPAGGSTVSLSSSNTLVSVPASVAVAANATNAMFAATAGANIPSNQSATLTATLGNSSKTAGINLVAPVLVSSLACNPASLAQSASTSCTVTLNQSAPAGGSTVSLTSGNALLSVPGSVTVAANATTATFIATAGANIPSGQNAVITARLNSVARTFNMSLVTGTGGGSGGGSGGSGAPGGSGGSGGGGSSTAGTLTASTETTTFNIAPGAPATQTVALSYSASIVGPPSFTTVVTTSDPPGVTPWLSVSPGSGTMTAVPGDTIPHISTTTLTITADPSRFTPGASATGTITYIANAVSSDTTTVTLNVTSQSDKVTVAPQSVSFTWQQGASVMPASQALSIFSNPGGATITAAAGQSANWLSIGMAQGTTPVTLPLSVNPATLGPGTYTTTVNIAASSTGSPIQVPVTLTVISAPPQLSLGSAQEDFALLQGGAPATGQVVVMNAGGGTLQFSAQASVAQGNWLTLNGSASGSATPLTPAGINFSVNPAGLIAGVYSGRITVEDIASGKQSSVAIVMAVSQSNQLLTSSLSGITFNAVQGQSAPPAQSFVVYSRGSSASGWSVQVQGANWLSVSPGSSTSAETKVEAVVNQNGLQPGQYSASIEILSPDAANSPQSVSVLLNVLPTAQATSGIEFSTGGVVFLGNPGSQMQTRQVTVFNPSNTQTGYSATANSSTGQSWLSVSAPAGVLQPGANVLTIGADFSGLTAGVQNGTVTVGIGGGGVATIQVAALAAASTSAISSLKQRPQSGATPRAVAGGCLGGEPGLLVPVFAEPMAGAVLTAGLAQTVRVEAVDDCGDFLTETSGNGVQVTFGNGDTTLNLHDTGAGIWEATWVPAHIGASVTLDAVASGPGSAMASFDAGIITAVQSPGAVSAPQISGIVNAALGGQGTPGVVVPGGYIAIYGSNLNAGTPATASSLPLPSNLNGAQLFLGGQPLPLLYAGPNQVNALVPQSLNPNTSYQLSVVNGSSPSVPVSLIVAGLQPGIYTADLSGSGQGLVEISGTALLAGPASSISRAVQSGSEYLVAYCTGLGPVTGSGGQTAPADGVAAPADILYQTTGTVTATIGGVNVPVVFSGLTPTLVGLYQVNIQVPAGVPAGDAVPLIISVADPRTGVIVPSNTVTIAVQ